MSEIKEKLSIGNCQCLDKFNKHFLVSLIKEKIDSQKNYIKKVEQDRQYYDMREKHSSQYASANALININKEIMEVAELVKKRVENIPECKD